MQQDKDLPKAYEPGQVEDRVYEFWLKKGYFTPRIDRGRKPFTVIMPPPNVTGELHLGHALPATIEDIIVRWHRMKGEVTLWLPGFDHAGIATQVVIERQLAVEGLTKHDLGMGQEMPRGLHETAWEAGGIL
jgi:valyl-tRNA synthetase